MTNDRDRLTPTILLTLPSRFINGFSTLLLNAGNGLITFWASLKSDCNVTNFKYS